MKTYEILEHLADLKIRAFGKGKEELFSNMLLGMQESMKAKVRKSEEKTKQEIKITSPDREALLVDFLSEVLYLNQVNKETYANIKFKKFTDNEIEAELLDEKVEEFGEDIKAVTYHGLDIHQEDEIWQATVLFDI